MDEIRIEELEVFANHGVFPEENTLGQKFLVNAVLYTDTSKAGRMDDIHQSIHYGEVCQFITNYMRTHTFKLIESVAENMAAELLLSLERLSKIDLEIKKPWAPIGLSVNSVSVHITRGWHTAYLSFGSNMGDKKAYIDQGIASLREKKGCVVEAVSSYMETKPYGMTDQDVFLNGALKLRTILSPEELLENIHEIEAGAKRERIIHWGPRTLDMDIVFYDKEVLEEDDLVIPHADYKNRLFVLEPLAEIAPAFRDPLTKETVMELLQKLRMES